MSDPSQSPQQLIASCQGLVRSLAWKIHCKLPPNVDLEDLVSYGQVGLAEAAREFDASRGSQFTTFAYYRIRGAILDGLSKMNWFNRADYSRGRYERMANEVMNLEGTQPAEGTDAQLDDDVRWLKGVGGSLAMVYLCSQSSEERESGEAALSDPDAVAPIQTALQREMHQKLHEFVAALPADAASLIRATYFEGLTLKEAGERLGVSKAWASRLHAKALGQLARSFRLAQLGD